MKIFVYRLIFTLMLIAALILLIPGILGIIGLVFVLMIEEPLARLFNMRVISNKFGTYYEDLDGRK
ncbi:MAG TPA: hypothetical protein PKI14_04370 [Fervidobacterium sp.]|nr:hypothetical protein [Fervidobacterium sp.]